MAAGAAGAAEAHAPGLRPTVAVLVSRFPKVTETFILREVVEMERQGRPVLLAALLRERPPVVHPEARPWLERAQFAPWRDPALWRANLRSLSRRPGVYLGTLGRLALGTARDPGFLARSLVLFPKAVFLAERFLGAGVVHVHAHFATHPATAAWVVERLTGIPYSLTVHAHDLFVRRAFLEPKLARARFVRAISAFNKGFLTRLYPGLEESVAVVHVGVEPERYRRGAGGLHGGSAGPLGPLRLLTVAALEPYKGLRVLVEAAARLRGRLEREPEGREIVWEVVGEGRMRRRLEAELRSRGLAGTVRLVGAVAQDEVIRRLGEADLFVLPSVVARDGQMEGVPVALMEALASEVPVVASDLSGIPELVEDGRTGVLVPPGDAAALATAVERLVRDPARASRLAAAGRERVEGAFRQDATVARLGELLDRETGPAALDPVLREAIGACLAAAGLGGRPAGLRRLREGTDSRVAELLVGRRPGAGEAPRELVVKLHRSRPGESAPPPARARREAELLERLAESGAESGPEGPFGAPALRAPPPPTAPAALLLEPVRGEPLDRLLRRLRLQPGRSAATALEDAFRRSGAWLRWFRGQVGETLRHGDFWPGNVFVSDDRVEVIDFEGAGPGDPEDDPAWFLRHARLYLSAPGLGRRFRRLEAAFLEGLRGPGAGGGPA